MTRIARTIHIAFLPVVLCGVFGLLMNVNVTHAATVTTLHLNRPSNVTVGSVRVKICSKNGVCKPHPPCISLSEQNHDYPTFPVDALHAIVSLERYSGGSCDGDVNPQNQAVTLNTNGDTFVNVKNW